MFTYDAATKTNTDKRSKSTQTDHVHSCDAPVKCANKCDALKDKLSSCRRELGEYKKMSSKPTSICEQRAELFFRRLTQKAHKRLTQLVERKHDVHLPHVFVQFKLSPGHINYLKSVGSGAKPLNCSSLDRVRDVVDHLFDDMDLVGRQTWLNIAATRSVAFIPYFFLLLAALYTLHLLRRRPFMTFFLVCTCWQWYKMYKSVIAERERNILRVPPSCFAGSTSSEPTWMDGLNMWMRTQFSFNQGVEDHCAEYFKTLYVDAILEVNPAKAFGEVIGLVFFYPLTALGDYSGLSLQKFFSHIPSFHIIWIAPGLLLFLIAFVFAVATAVGQPDFLRNVVRPFRALSCERLERSPAKVRSRRDQHIGYIGTIPRRRDKLHLRAKSLEVVHRPSI